MYLCTQSDTFDGAAMPLTGLLHCHAQALRMQALCRPVCALADTSEQVQSHASHVFFTSCTGFLVMHDLLCLGLFNQAPTPEQMTLICWTNQA